MVVSYIGGTVHGSKGIGVETVAHSKLVRNLEERSHAEDLGQIGANSGEHEVGEEDIALDLSGERFYRSGVGEPELGSTV